MPKIQNDLNGWLVIDKPYGMGSTNVVSKLKWLMHPKKIGHAGTLDPLATGVLPIAFGKATKTISFVMDGQKKYQFIVKWGQETSTDDREGDVVASSEKRPSLDEIKAVLPDFVGDISQVPPVYSALKINGVRAYDLVRNGQTPEMKPRIVHIDSLCVMENVDLGQDGLEFDEAIKSEIEHETMFEVTCGKGTYVRSIAHDLGRKLGCYGHVTMLRRTACGPFKEEESILLANLEKNDYNTNALQLKSMRAVLSDISVLAVTMDQAKRLMQGLPLPVTEVDIKAQTDSSAVLGITYLDQLVALVKVQDGQIKPFRVLTDKI